MLVKKKVYYINPVKIKNLTAENIQSQLNDNEINALMNKSIQEIVNKWKQELDNQVHTFENVGEKLKNFELVFHKNIETVNFN